MKLTFPKLKKYEFYAVIVFLIYFLYFLLYFLLNKNNEFSFYSIFLFVIFLLFYFNFRKMDLSPFVLWGFVVLGFMHLFGGAIYIFGERLYDVLSFGLIDWGGEFVLIKYDQIIHFASTFFVAVALFEIFSKYFFSSNKNKNNSLVYFLIIFCAFGISSFNEIVEFAPGYFWSDTGVGGYVNTILDLCFNLLGAVFGIIFVSFRVKKEKI